MLRLGAEPKLVACLIAESSTLAHDWAVRQKIGGVHMNAFYRSQLPNFPPSAYTEEDIAFVHCAARVGTDLHLVFAEAVGGGVGA